MFTSLTLSAFKSFKELESIKLAPLTVISGINSSGKSSIIQAIRIMGRLALGSTILNAIPEGHGGLKDIVNKASAPGDLSINLEDSVEGVISNYAYSHVDGIMRCEGGFPENVFIGADRFGARPSIPLENHEDLGPRGENILKVLKRLEDEEIPEAARHPKAEKHNLLPNLVAWLNDISSGVRFDYALQEIADTSYTSFNGHRAANVGFGLSYTMPVILALLWGALKPGRVVMLENPEAHLHPKGQSKIAELICKTVNAGSQVILETHSDHIINGIRVRTKRFEEGEEGIDRSKVALIHVLQNQGSGHSACVPVIIDEGGRIYSAPEDFFDQFNIDRRELLGI